MRAVEQTSRKANRSSRVLLWPSIKKSLNSSQECRNLIRQIQTALSNKWMPMEANTQMRRSHVERDAQHTPPPTSPLAVIVQTDEELVFKQLLLQLTGPFSTENKSLNTRENEGRRSATAASAAAEGVTSSPLSCIREKWIINPRISIDRLQMEEKQQRR